MALDPKRRWSPHRGYDYYGTELRDLAAMTALFAEIEAPGVDIGALVGRLQQRLAGAGYLSTQEEGWTVMAGAALSGGQAMTVAVDGAAPQQRTAPLYLRADATKLGTGLTLANAGSEPVWTTASVFGVAAEPRPAVQDAGYKIERRYFDLAGNETTLEAVPRNAVVVVLVTLSDTAESWNQSLLIDLLPAGFEIENLRLANARATGDFAWLPELAETNYVEYLDDRFVAAFTSYGGNEYSFAYMMRAVTPGRYRVPGSAVEDMYLPDRIGRTAMGEAEIVAEP
jgi:uncharacterized protein YfaS (alpha-2-macroglobulin family)